MNRIKFFQSPFYRFNGYLLVTMAQWPYHSSNWKTLHQIVLHLNIITVMLVQMIKMVEEWGDVDIMIECFTPTGVMLASCMKTTNSMINRSKMINLLRQVESDWASLTEQREIDILKKFATQGKNLTVTYMCLLFASGIVYLVIPLLPQIFDIVLPLNETRQRRSLFHTEYYIDQEKYYWTIVLHTYGATVWTIVGVVAVDAMYFTFVQHVCGIMAITSYRLKKTIENIDLVNLDVNVAIQADVQYQELVSCIKKHQDAIEFAVLIESTYSNSYLLQLGIATILISTSLLQLLTKFGQYEEMYRVLQFTLAQICHLFFNSWPGQKLMDESANLSESIYLSGWYGFSLRSRSLIKIIMIRAQEPLKITASGLYEMSMENFGTVIQTSVSYFTVLASLR